MSTSPAVCLGAQTDQLPRSTFWTVSGGLVSGLLTQRRRSCGEAHDLTLRLRHAVSVGSVRCARRLSPCARPKVRYRELTPRATYSHAHGKHARYLGATSCPSDHTCGHPLPRVCPKGRLNGAYRLTVYVCHAFCSKVQATSTDLLFGAGGAPGRLRYDRVSTWCTLAGLSLGLLGSRAPSK